MDKLDNKADFYDEGGQEQYVEEDSDHYYNSALKVNLKTGK